jgi:outer membrane protein with beta-barrel domain
MRRLLPCLCLMLFSAGAVLAQNTDYPKWDVTAGFTANRMETPPPQRHFDMYGFTGAVGWNFRRWAALEGDFTYTGGDLNGIHRSLYTYIAGPRFTKRFTRSPAQPFVHALIGGGHLSGFGNSTNGWAGKFGGGVDIVAGKHIAIRAFQVDYYRYHGHVNVGTQRLNNMTGTFGIRIF